MTLKCRTGAQDSFNMAKAGSKIGPGFPKLASRYLHGSPSRRQDGSICAQVNPKIDEVGPKTVQSRASMPPNELLLVASWPQECMKAGKSKTLKNQMKNNDFSGLRCPSWAQDGKDSCKVGHKLAPVAPNLAKVRPMLWREHVHDVSVAIEPLCSGSRGWAPCEP